MTHKLVPFYCRLQSEEGNPGDIFIAIGLQKILQDALGSDGNILPWLNLSKFKPGHIKKHIDLVKKAGFMIIGGTPQYNNYDDWCMWYDRELWQEFLVPNKIKVLPMAGGSGYPSTTMNPREFADHCLKSEQTKSILNMRCDISPFFTVRDAHSEALLRRFDRKPEVKLLGCSATFSSMARNIEWGDEGILAIVPPGPGSVPIQYCPEGIRSITDVSKQNEAKAKFVLDKFISCGRTLAEEQGLHPVFVCHNFPEYLMFNDMFIPRDQLFVTNDYNAYLDFYARCNTVLSGRLHGALPAFGMCGPKVIHVGIDTRMSAIDYFGEWIPNIRFQDMSEEVILEAMKSALPWKETQRHHEYWDLQVQFYRNRVRKEGILT